MVTFQWLTECFRLNKRVLETPFKVVRPPAADVPSPAASAVPAPLDLTKRLPSYIPVSSDEESDDDDEAAPSAAVAPPPKEKAEPTGEYVDKDVRLFPFAFLSDTLSGLCGHSLDALSRAVRCADPPR